MHFLTKNADKNDLRDVLVLSLKHITGARTMVPKLGFRRAGVCIVFCVSLVPLAFAVPPACSNDFVSAIVSSHSRSQRYKPQLSFPQMLWIASALRTAQAEHGSTFSFLVFGLGADTPVWLAINCRARTVFVENSPEWIKLVTESIAVDYQGQLEAHAYTYKARMKDADEFFVNPWIMDLPKNVSDTCYGVILVDAPQGYSESAGK